MSSDIDNIIHPTVLTSFHTNMPPVKCNVWKGATKYETIEFDQLYPFDTLDTIKQHIFNRYKTMEYFPRFTFVGIKDADDEKSMDARYLPLDYLWYSNGTKNTTDAFKLMNPIKALTTPDTRFVTSDGSYSSPNYQVRGRTTIEHAFLKSNDGEIPELYVFTLQQLISEYKGSKKPISEAEWNKKFAPYFPDVKISSVEETDADEEFANKINFFVEQRQDTLEKIESIIGGGVNLPQLTVSGIKQMMFLWSKPVEGFEGAANLFYQLRVTDDRPYFRLIPPQGSAITKLHVRGVLPIPTLDHPELIEQWGKENTSTPTDDFFTIKYVHRPSIGITPPIYGTIHVLNDGTIKLLLQPPKSVRKLDPMVDFRDFSDKIERVFDGLPQMYSMFEIKEISCIFSMKIGLKDARFTKNRIMLRLPYFQPFFKEIKSLPEDNPLLSLRYKAVSQYASEDKIFTFITQVATSMALDGDAPNDRMIQEVQNEFQLSRLEATNVIAEWFRQRATFTVEIPEEGEFVGSYHPGIDIHIYAQHPSYFFHVNRVDSSEDYIRIYTLLSTLFLEDDGYFKGSNPIEDEEMEVVVEEMESRSLKREEPESNEDTAASKSSRFQQFDDEDDDVFINPIDDLSDGIVEGQVIPEDAPKAATAAIAKVEDKVAKKPVAIIAAKKQEDRPRLINPSSWFINKLQEIDARLFKYKTTEKGQLGYSRQCAANDDRQPSILSKDQYERMREIYEDDPIFWIEYPLKDKSDPIQPLGIEETMTVMKYGSDGDNINYYFCPKYFCLYDQLLVREVDFLSDTDRDDNPKPPNTCPFCQGGLITDRKNAILGNTVIKRKNKKDTMIYHKFIDFLGKSSHPESFSMPCCFVKQSTLRVLDPKFSHIRTQLQDELLENHVENREDYEKKGNNESKYNDDGQPIQTETDDGLEEDADDFADKIDLHKLLLRTKNVINYTRKFSQLHSSYILETNKRPSAGIFAACMPPFDKFFNQNSTERIIKRPGVHLKLQENAVGFLRIGTENTIYESLLGVLAPIIRLSTIDEVKDKILSVIHPRIFLNSHFGNLVLEFYNPADGSVMPATQQELMRWASKELQIQISSTNIYPLVRIYNAYNRFIKFIKDPMQRKDLRHIQPLLAEPGLFTTNGIQLIVMDEKPNEPIRIMCPIYGVSMDRHRKNDFVFLSRSMKNIGVTDNMYARYELYFHTSNKAGRGGQTGIHQVIIEWDYSSYPVWPEIVQKRVQEYLTQCQSRYRSIYTSQKGIHPMALISLSVAVQSTNKKISGIVKDQYNHIVAITFPSDRILDHHIALPVIDDGVISISTAFTVKGIFLDWEDFKASPVEDVIEQYKNDFEKHYSLYEGYVIKHIVKNRVEDKIVAVQLQNGIYIPVGVPINQDKFKKYSTDITTVTIEEFEWNINKKISGIKSFDRSLTWDETIEGLKEEKKCGSDPKLIESTTYSEYEEFYQQFRMMVSNWMTSPEAGADIRNGIERIIFDGDFMEYEKRKRLYIYLGSTLLSWFYADPNEWESDTLTFLRKDCRIIDSPESCTGSCHWKQDANEEGKCLLHVNETTMLGNEMVSTPEMFTKRVIDELIRFPIRRHELLTRGKISRVTAIIQPIRMGDQYIIPESSISWSEMLRLDWMKQTPEKPVYYEEMSREKDDTKDDTKDDEDDEEKEEKEHRTRYEIFTKYPMLSDIFSAAGEYMFVFTPLDNGIKPLLPVTGILGVSITNLKIAPRSRKLTIQNLGHYVDITKNAIGMIDITDNSIVFVKDNKRTTETVLLIISDDEIGIVKRDDSIMLNINEFPPRLKEKWNNSVTVDNPVPAFAKEVKDAVVPRINVNPPAKEEIPLIVDEKRKEKALIEKELKPGERLIPKKKKKVVEEKEEKVEELKPGEFRIPRKKKVVEKIEEKEPIIIKNPAISEEIPIPKKIKSAIRVVPEEPVVPVVPEVKQINRSEEIPTPKRKLKLKRDTRQLQINQLNQDS